MLPEMFFRGRKLQGAAVALPDGYCVSYISAMELLPIPEEQHINNWGSEIIESNKSSHWTCLVRSAFLGGTKQKAENEVVLESCLKIILLRLIIIIWTIAMVIEQMSKFGKGIAFVCGLYYAAEIFSVSLGVISCFFPIGAPKNLGIVAFGAWQSLLFSVAVVHFLVFSFSPRSLVVYCSIGGLFTLSFLIVSYFWGSYVKRPEWLYKICQRCTA